MGQSPLYRLTAWNEGDTDAIPAGYGPDSLDWQRDLRAVLGSVITEGRLHRPSLDIENVGNGPFPDDATVFLASIAISLKRLSDRFEGVGREYVLGHGER